MPVLTFPCPKCKNPMGFDYADYDCDTKCKEWK